MKKIQKILAIGLCALFSVLGAVPMYAQVVSKPIASASTSSITPFYDYITTVSSSLAVSNGVATAKTNISSNRLTTTKVSISMTLQKKNSSGSWSDEKSWSSTFNSYTGNLSKTHSVSKGTYRVKGSFTAYTSSGSESTTVYSAEKTY